METTDDELLEGVLRDDARALRALLARLRPQCLRVLWDRFARLGDSEAEILDEAESLLFEWSRGPGARERLLRGEPLGKLAFRLVWQVARDKLRGRQRHERLSDEVVAAGDSPAVDPPAAGFGVEPILALILALPDTHREVLLAEARCQLGGGPPIAAALAVRPSAARMRLQRARVAFLEALHERGLSELMDLEAGDG